RRYLHQRNQPVERRSKTDILHVMLQVFEAVFDGKAGIEGVLVEIASAVHPGRKAEAEIAGDCEWLQPSEAVRQVAEAFAEVEGGRERRVIVRAALVDHAGMSPIDVEPDKPHELMLSVDEELVLRACAEPAKAAERWHALRLKVVPTIRCG